MIDKIITVTPSSKLDEMKLGGIVGRQGKIVEDLTQIGRKSKGYFVEFVEPYQEYNVWYIPLESIKYE